MTDLFIWVLAPHVDTTDPTISYYYEYESAIAEFTRAFADLGWSWQWCPVTLESYPAQLDQIAAARTDGRTHVVFNLCDGDEDNGVPGVTVIDALEARGLAYTGADRYFYEVTTSKITMKRLFDKAAVAHASWMAIDDPDQVDGAAFDALPKPVILKPAVSAGSIGLGVRNVLHDRPALDALLADLRQGYRGWKVDGGGFVAEQFIRGAEYTCFIVGDHNRPGSALIYPPVERRFHPALREEERFLSFDRLWEFYEGETPINEYEDFYNYHPVAPALGNQVNALCWEAYCAVGGTGYGRVDVRRDDATGMLYVLEVNAQCGLSEDENYTSIGAILRLAGEPYAQLCRRIVMNALEK